jgi:hypothetical protein
MNTIITGTSAKSNFKYGSGGKGTSALVIARIIDRLENTAM